MFEFYLLPIDEKITFALYDNQADKYFIKSLIRCFKRYDVLTHIKKDYEKDEDIIEFNNNFIFDVKNENMTQDEYDDLKEILSILFFSIKDEFNIELKENTKKEN